jgi:4-amino-4-deoxy-L-arabinose transferase-like glycosyltransferase
MIMAIMKRIDKKSIFIIVLLLVALSIRLWGINYDLPYIYHPDEPWPIRIGHQMLVTGDYNPHFYDWPSLIIYLNMIIQAIYNFIIGIINHSLHFGIINPLIELTMGVTYSTEPSIVLIGRLVTVVCGMATIVATLWAGKKISQNILVGLLAGTIMIISPTNVSLNRFITPDTYATFFISIVFLVSVYIFQKGNTWAYIIAGISLGLAVSSKYNSILIATVILAGHFLRTGYIGFKDYRLYITFLIGGLTFIAVNPFSLLDFHNFYVSFLQVNSHYSTGHDGMEGNSLRWYLNYMWSTAGIIYILAIIEILRGFYLRSKPIILMAIFPVIYFIFIASYVVRNDRTFIPITPFMYLLAASFILNLLNKIRTFQVKALRIFSVSAIICIFITSLILPASITIKNTIHLTTINSRETARIWINENLATGSKIAIESYSPFVDPTRFDVIGLGRMIDHEPEWYIEQGFSYLVFSQGMYGRYYQDPLRYATQKAQYDQIFNKFNLIKSFNDGNYEIRIYKINNST